MQTNLSIEPLEPRIAPASITINAAAKTATWTDWDGDLVTLKYTSAVAPVFDKTDDGTGLRLDKITLNKTDHTDAAFTLTVKAAGGGDGRIDLGRVDAKSVPLKSWSSPAASIAEFDCGNGNKAIGTFLSAALGAIPYTKFSNTDGNGSCFLSGDVGSFTVRGDIASTSVTLQGKIGTVTVTGSLRGDAPDSGQDVGTLAMNADRIDRILIGGSIIGGDEVSEGRLLTNNGPVGKVTVLGDIVGGPGDQTGVFSVNDPKSVLIRGSIIGGEGARSGTAYVDTAGTVTVGGSLLGGAMEKTGVLSAQSIASLTIKGSIVGGSETTASTNLHIGAVDVSGDLKTFVLGGNLVAGTYGSGTEISYNGAVTVDGNLGSAIIKGSIIGHDDAQYAILMAQGAAPAKPGNYNAIGKLTVGGSVSFGYIAAGHETNTSNFDFRIGTAENPDAGIGSITVGGDWVHSSLSAGINDSANNGVQSSDTRDMGDAARQAVIGPIAIKGYILDHPTAKGYSGFVAEKIASITAHGVKLFKTGDAAKSLDPFGYVDVVEL